MDTKKLLRTMTIGQGSILVPHINAYQDRGKFPDAWNITLPQWTSSGTSKYFRPSRDCFTPPKQLWLEKKGLAEPEKPITASLRRTFDVGAFWHDYLAQILIEMKFVKPENVEVRVKEKISTEIGSADVAGVADLVDVEIPGYGKWLIDMKTMRKDDFGHGLDQHKQLQYNAQLNIYGDLLNCDQMMILAIEKDSPHRLREFIIPKDTHLVADIYDRWTYTSHCLEIDTEPDDRL